MEKQKRKSDCPVNLSLEIFGDNWTLLILRDIIFFDHRYYKQFVKLEGISTNILANRLERLLNNGILIREVDKVNQSSYLYSLTKKGLALVPVVIEIYNWGAQFTENNNAEKDMAKRAKHQKDALVKEFVTKLKKNHNIK